MKEYSISICIPCYNVEKYIARCLDSLLEQSLKDIEIVCVDDCSTDRTLEILLNYSNMHSNIRVISHARNQQSLMARKTAVHNSNGKYIMFLDSDDILDCNACEFLYNVIEESKTDIVEFGGKSVKIIDGGQKIIDDDYCPHVIGRLEEQDIFPKLMANKLGQMMWNKIYSKHVVLQTFSVLRINNIYSRDDVYFCSILFSLAKSYLGIDKKFYSYTLETGQSRKTTTTLKQLAEICKAADVVYSYIDIFYEYQMFDQVKCDFINSKTKRWLCQITFSSLMEFIAKDEFEEAIRIFTQKWIKIEHIEYYLKHDSKLFDSFVSCISDSYVSCILQLSTYLRNMEIHRDIIQLVNHLNEYGILAKKLFDDFNEKVVKPQIDIFGSCVCRDIFNFDSGTYHISKYINGCSPASVVSMKLERLDIQESDFVLRSNFEKRSCCIDINKGYREFFSSDGNIIDTLIIDLCDARLDIGIVKTDTPYNYCFTVGTTFKDNYENDRINGKLIDFCYCNVKAFDIPEKQWERIIVDYIDYIRSELAPKKIIVVETLCAEEYCDSEGIHQFSNVEYIRKLNKLYMKLYAILYKELSGNNISVVRLPEGFIADKNHKLGLFPVHYTGETYQTLLSQIDAILDQ